MEENKYICPKCGSEMIISYEKPALNLTCPKCGCKIATTKWDEIDLDDTDYEIVLKPIINPSINQIKFVSHLTGQNFIISRDFLEKGGTLLKAKAVELKVRLEELKKLDFEYNISPHFPY